MGYEVDIAETGAEVLLMINKKRYNVILMDVQMPQIDGIEATQIIRKQNRFQPYIIAMTANAMPEDREICINEGMDDYLAKPMKVNELINALKRAAYVIYDSDNDI